MQPVLSSHSRKGFMGYVGTPMLLALWAALSYSGAVNPLVLPPPDRVVLAISDIGLSPLLAHFAATASRVIVGYIGSLATGGVIGVLMQYYRGFYAFADGVIESWRPVPPVALIPFFILIFGFSETGRLVIVVLGTTLVIVVTVVEALDRVSPSLIRLGLVAGLSKPQLFRWILLPAAVPNTRAGFRIALALTVTLVVVSEFLGAQYGLGYLINVSKVTLTTPTIFLCVVLLGVIGFAADLTVRAILGYVSKWEYTSKEAIR
jgi:ABC-type nitrate/sulfonate/bicarbonate transport system permease component